MSVISPFTSSACGVQQLLAAERQQLFVSPAARWAALMISSRSSARRVLGRQSAVSELGESENHRQQVVEIVRDARCQLADCVHLARLPDLRLERPPLA